jgi:hypothetical protein
MTHCVCGRAKKAGKVSAHKSVKSLKGPVASAESSPAKPPPAKPPPAKPKPTSGKAEPTAVEQKLAAALEATAVREAKEEELAAAQKAETAVVRELFNLVGHGGPFLREGKEYRVRRGGERHWLKQTK